MTFKLYYENGFLGLFEGLRGYVSERTWSLRFVLELQAAGTGWMFEYSKFNKKLVKM